MKRFFMAVVLVGFMVIPVSVCFAVNQKNTGCGLGSVVMQGNDGLVFQVLAATTNGTSGNQTFGMTSGTSNCEKPSRFVSVDRINSYVADNMDNLANDIAKGDGEYLDTLAVLMGVPEGSRIAFNSKLQNNFSRIYPSTEVNSLDVVNNIFALM